MSLISLSDRQPPRARASAPGRRAGTVMPLRRDAAEPRPGPAARSGVERIWQADMAAAERNGRDVGLAAGRRQGYAAGLCAGLLCGLLAGIAAAAGVLALMQAVA